MALITAGGSLVRSQTTGSNSRGSKLDNVETIADYVHQFRAPLAGLKMACEQLAEDPKNEELLSVMVRTIPRQVDVLYEITDKIGTNSRASSDEGKIGGKKYFK